MSFLKNSLFPSAASKKFARFGTRALCTVKTQPRNEKIGIDAKKLNANAIKDIRTIPFSFAEMMKGLQNETKLYVAEYMDGLDKGVYFRKHGSTLLLFSFLEGAASFKYWTCMCDDVGSDATFTLSPTTKTAIFSGRTVFQKNNPERVKLPVKYSSWAAIRTRLRYKAFGFPLTFPRLEFYNCIVIRYRGDGRKFIFNVYNPLFFTFTKHDHYTYPLLTRGGPYWEYAIIPYSKFIPANKGKITTERPHFNTHIVRAFGITLFDNLEGPFFFEIDYIAAYYDAYVSKESVYERYVSPAIKGRFGELEDDE